MTGGSGTTTSSNAKTGPWQAYTETARETLGTWRLCESRDADGVDGQADRRQSGSPKGVPVPPAASILLIFFFIQHVFIFS